MESGPLIGTGRTPSIEIRALGALTIVRNTVTLNLPASRKVRALLAYLSLAAKPVSRSQLCDLLWDTPNDPRGELRWCLSKIRGLVDEPERPRVHTHADTISLDLADCFVDAIEVTRATANIETLSPQRLRALAAMFAGDFLDGLEIEGSTAFNGWLISQRRRFRGCRAALLEQLVKGTPEDEVISYLEQWLQLAPFDLRVHELLLQALAQRSLIREAEEHVTAAMQLFEDDGLDCAPLRDTWRRVRTEVDGSPSARAVVSSGLIAPSDRTEIGATMTARRASVAVMPFVDCSPVTSARGGIADALAHDIITRLAKLRSLFVIAQGTVFALYERRIGSEEAGRMLNVDFITNGSVRRLGQRLTVTVELTETRTARIIWAETFNHALDDAFDVLDEIGNSIVASIDSEIETSERNRAVLKAPNSLDSWEAHHRGLWHMYRFNRSDNEKAQQFFEMAVRLDPTFARAYAGLSFTHFQNAFQGWTERGPQIDRAYETAGQGLMADDRDPSAHWAVGRALWLRGQYEQCVVELEQAVDLSPNFALGHYTMAFVQSQAGDADAAISAADHSRHLSPYDPLLFGMLGSRAMALVRLRRFEEAAEWGMKAAARPNAHIIAIAAFSLALAGRLGEARSYLASIRKALPNYTVEDFLAAMRFAPDSERSFRDGAKRIGAD